MEKSIKILNLHVKFTEKSEKLLFFLPVASSYVITFAHSTYFRFIIFPSYEFFPFTFSSDYRVIIKLCEENEKK